MSWIVIIVDSNDNKVRTGSLYLKKVALGPVRGDQFLLVFRIRLPVRSILLLSFSFSIFWILYYQGLSFILYYPLPPFFTFHVQIQIGNSDTCPISPSLKSLGVTVRLDLVSCRAFKVVVAALSQIFYSSHLSCPTLILTPFPGMVQNVALNGRLCPLSSALPNQGGILPRFPPGWL